MMQMGKYTNLAYLVLIVAILGLIYVMGKDVFNFFSHLNPWKDIQTWGTNFNRSLINWNTQLNNEMSYNSYGHKCSIFEVYDPTIGKCVPRPMR